MDDRFQTALKAEGLSVFMKQIPQLGGTRASPRGPMGAGEESGCGQQQEPLAGLRVLSEGTQPIVEFHRWQGR